MGGSSEGEGEDQDWWVEARESKSEFYTDCASEPDCWEDPPVMEMSTMQLPATLVAGAEVVELSQGVVEETNPAQPRGPSCPVAPPPASCDVTPVQPRGPSCPVAPLLAVGDVTLAQPRGPSCPVAPPPASCDVTPVGALHALWPPSSLLVMLPLRSPGAPHALWFPLLFRVTLLLRSPGDPFHALWLPSPLFAVTSTLAQPRGPSCPVASSPCSVRRCPFEAQGPLMPCGLSPRSVWRRPFAAQGPLMPCGSPPFT